MMFDREEKALIGGMVAFAIVANLLIYGGIIAGVAIAVRWVLTGTLPW